MLYSQKKNLLKNSRLCFPLKSTLQYTVRSPIHNPQKISTMENYVYSIDGSVMIRLVLMWSTQNRPRRKLTCSLRKIWSNVCYILFNIIFAITFPIEFIQVMPHQFSKNFRTPFLRIVITVPSLQLSRFIIISANVNSSVGILLSTGNLTSSILIIASSTSIS